MKVQNTAVNLLWLFVAAEVVGATAASPQKISNDHLPSWNEDLIIDAKDAALAVDGAREVVKDEAVESQIGRSQNLAATKIAYRDDQADPPNVWSPLSPNAPPPPPAYTPGQWLNGILGGFGFGDRPPPPRPPQAGSARPPPLLPGQTLGLGQQVPPGWIPYVMPTAGGDPGAWGAGAPTVTSISVVTLTQAAVTSISILPGTTSTVKVTETFTQAYTYDQVTVTQYYTYPQVTVTQMVLAPTPPPVTLTQTVLATASVTVSVPVTQPAITLTVTTQLPPPPAITVTITDTAGPATLPAANSPPMANPPLQMPNPPLPMSNQPFPIPNPPLPSATNPGYTGLSGSDPINPPIAPTPVSVAATGVSSSSTWYCRTRCDGSWGPGRTPAAGAPVQPIQQQAAPPRPTPGPGGRPYQGPQGYTPYGSEAWRGVNEMAEEATLRVEKARSVNGASTTSPSSAATTSPSKSRQRVPTMTRHSRQPQEEAPKTGSGPAATPPAAGNANQGAQPGDAVASTQAPIPIETQPATVIVQPDPMETVIIDAPDVGDTESVAQKDSPSQDQSGDAVVVGVSVDQGSLREIKSPSRQEMLNSHLSSHHHQLGNQRSRDFASDPPPDQFQQGIQQQQQFQPGMDPNFPTFDPNAQPAPFPPQEESDDVCADGLDGRAPASGMCRARQKEEEAKLQQELALEKQAQQQQQAQQQAQQSAQKPQQQGCDSTWYNPFSWLSGSNGACQQQQQQQQQDDYFKRGSSSAFSTDKKPAWRGMGPIRGVKRNAW